MFSLRKIIRAVLSRCELIKHIFIRQWLNLTHVGINLEPGVSVNSNVKIAVTDGGKLMVRSGTSIATGVQIKVQCGSIEIGKNVFIGVGTIIVAQESITIDDDTQIAEYVVIRDQDHRTDSSPIRSAGFHTSPILIGKDVWIGSKATILRGVTIGEHSVVAAHSVVNNDVPSGVVVAGIPARIVKKHKLIKK